MSEDFFGGALHLIYNDTGNPTLLANWRPINISNVDYCLLARILNERLIGKMAELLMVGQSSAVLGWRMTNSLRLIQEVFDVVQASGAGVWWRWNSQRPLTGSIAPYLTHAKTQRDPTHICWLAGKAVLTSTRCTSCRGPPRWVGQAGLGTLVRLPTEPPPIEGPGRPIHERSAHG